MATDQGKRMQSKNIIWLASGAIIVALLAWNLFKPAGGGIENVDAAGVQAALKQPGVQVIDVRTAGEFQMGHLPGAINVPVDQVSTAAQSWDRAGTYVVYCATGARSTTAVDTMKSMGFTNIKHFAAGIQAWPEQLETGAASSTPKVETNGKPVVIEFFTNS